jgi:replicative DNA helicase
LPIFINDTASLGITELKHQVRKYRREKGIKMIVIDYLQLMDTGKEKGVNREQAISGISRALKVLAKETGIPIIALSQLNREIEKKGGNVP